MKNIKKFLLTLNLLIVWLIAVTAHGAVTGVTFTALGGFNTNNGANPYAVPVFGPDGSLYGATPLGGSNGFGAIYKITTNSIQTTLHIFANSDGINPVGQLIFGADGNLYGAASGGGTNDQGTIFKVTTNGDFTVLYSFGMIANDLGYAVDGSAPYSGLVLGQDGNFYGVTYVGGTNDLGTVFQFSTNGTLTTLYSFTGNGTNDDGANPYTAPLVEGSDGVFYGTTSAGGTNNTGTIFKITIEGALTILHEFDQTNSANPYAGLNFGSDANLYGTTIAGGIPHDSTNGDGTVFQVSTNGNFAVLFKFSGTNGVFPEGGVVADLNNNLYGTTYDGGVKGYGTIFRLTTNGLMTTLYSFTNSSDGAHPYAGVIRDAKNNLYGTTLYGGNYGGYGLVYRFSDPTRPTNIIIAPTANQRLSNNVFTITGTAKDNIGVANVFYSLNNSIWTAATLTNNRSNWAAQVTLMPGTNSLQAYTTDDSGNTSITNTVKFVYVVTAPLSVSINGKGTVTTNYNGALLQIGVNYSMTAAPSTGFGFAGWTGSIVTNSATLKFMMASNLTFSANFVDIAKPTNSISAPTSNQNVSNAIFIVTGKARDNVGVTNVFYSLNNSDWLPATTTNNWTNWTAQVTLTPGTNTLLAYAADAAGNVSSNNTVKFVYILSAPLSVGTNGFGTISPNYNGTLLQIGVNYSMTATAVKGFSFTGWTGSATTNNATLKFLMTSNLTFMANFVDTTRPTNSITSPTSGQHLTNALATIIGKATDNWGCSGVLYQVNSDAWSPAISTNGYTNWTATATLISGTNTLKAYAIDLAGNFSATNSLSVVSSNSFLLRLDFTNSQPMTSGGLSFTLETSPGLNGHIQASTNLTSWANLTNFIGTNSTITITDGSATNSSQKFYRAVVP